MSGVEGWRWCDGVVVVTDSGGGSGDNGWWWLVATVGDVAIVVCVDGVMVPGLSAEVHVPEVHRRDRRGRL